MAHSFPYILAFLVAGIVLIVVLTTKFKVPAFFALFAACLLVGLGIGLPLTGVIGVMKEGFGNILKSLGLIIVLGTALGLLLEYTGSTAVMASFLVKKLGDKRAPLAMSITGFIVGLPIFCDSGFIVLNGLNKSMARRTGIPITVMSVSLATGLLAVHCLAPPHPGATAAAVDIGADIGKLMIIGGLTAIPAMIVGHLWAKYAGRATSDKVTEEVAVAVTGARLPSLTRACIPVIVPILLIALKSFLTTGTAAVGGLTAVLAAIGDPVIALLMGVLLALNCKRGWTRKEAGGLLQESAEKAGGILVIIGMGGAFGAILAAARIGDHFSHMPALGNMGIFFPFLLTAVLKTAQGSSTVAMITAAPILLSLLPALGLNTETGRLLAVLSMGGGSMVISHANDAYFWVIAKFAGLEMKTMLKVYSLATALMGFTTLGVVYILSKLL